MRTDCSEGRIASSVSGEGGRERGRKEGEKRKGEKDESTEFCVYT